ncbi:MAG: methionine--tRNA ligase [Alphaproteobacteria bacterium]|nr:methionine--tRNA ligase [Alphaproteobacteria bacterium]
MTDARYYITTPIYYVNDKPHIGHAYTTLACDAIARFMRLDGRDVYFLTGTDEHGQKVEKSARDAGMEPQPFTDRVSQNFRDLAKAMNFSNDDFIRTTEERHKRSCRAIWQKLVKSGDIYLGTYSGWYAVRDEAFYGEEELTAGPDGKKTAPSGAPVEWVEEPSYFFRLSAWGERLLKFYEDNPLFVLPQSRRNEVTSFVRQGLRDLSVSRTSFRWGVKVPGDEAHIMYVWLDALTNYITAVGYPDESNPKWAYWPADLHMVGKDIVRFHAIYWPAFLMSAGIAPPKRVFAHGWWTNEGQKISKSLGNIIDPLKLIETYGLDQTRYFLLREVPFGNDGDFSHKAMVGRINAELANGIGNLAQRTLSFINKNCGGKLPAPGQFMNDDITMIGQARGLLELMRASIENQELHRAIDAWFDVVVWANQYIDRHAPWALRKTDVKRMGTVLYVLVDVLRHLGALMQPFMPEAGAKLLDQLAVPSDERSFASLGGKGELRGGIPLPAPVGIFPRFIEDAQRKVHPAHAMVGRIYQRRSDGVYLRLEKVLRELPDTDDAILMFRKWPTKEEVRLKHSHLIIDLVESQVELEW